MIGKVKLQVRNMIESGPRGDRTHNPRIKRQLDECRGMPFGGIEVRFVQHVVQLRVGECRVVPDRLLESPSHHLPSTPRPGLDTSAAYRRAVSLSTRICASEGLSKVRSAVPSAAIS
jgi:hypothetical protein